MILDVLLAHNNDSSRLFRGRVFVSAAIIHDTFHIIAALNEIPMSRAFSELVKYCVCLIGDNVSINLVRR